MRVRVYVYVYVCVYVCVHACVVVVREFGHSRRVALRRVAPVRLLDAITCALLEIFDRAHLRVRMLLVW